MEIKNLPPYRLENKGLIGEIYEPMDRQLGKKCMSTKYFIQAWGEGIQDTWPSKEDRKGHRE